MERRDLITIFQEINSDAAKLLNNQKSQLMNCTVQSLYNSDAAKLLNNQKSQLMNCTVQSLYNAMFLTVHI